MQVRRKKRPTSTLPYSVSSRCIRLVAPGVFKGASWSVPFLAIWTALNFPSTNYKWLAVAGSKAQFKGEGTINSEGNYGFMLTAIDEALTPSTDSDLFRIKIWDKDNGDIIVYDNQMGEDDDSEAATAIGGGNIVIHKTK